MAENERVPFPEADENKLTIMASCTFICAVLAWLSSGSVIGLTIVLMLWIYLMTGDRYEWAYISWKTQKRDWKGARALINTASRIWWWEQRGITLVTRWKQVVSWNPDKPALIMGNRTVTFKQGEEFSNRIAWYFKKKGFKRGDVIGVFMDTQPEFVFIWLGLAKIGVISALVNSNLRGIQLNHCLTVAKCKALIFGDEMSDAIEDIRKDIFRPDCPLFQYDSPEREKAALTPGAYPLNTQLEDMPIHSVPDGPAKPRDTLVYIYTSGTTGFPKAAVITNMRFLLIPLGVHMSARLNSNDVIYDPLPLYHTAGGLLGVGQALVFGCTVVLRKKFSATNYWTDAKKYGCTASQYIGEICRYLLSTPPGPADNSHNVRIIIGNGLRSQIWEKFINRFNIKDILEFYGATEGNSNLVNLDNKVGSIGFLSRFVEFALPMTLVRCDEITGEILRGSNGLCIRCKPYEPGLFLGKIDSSRAITTFSGYADKTASEKKMVRDVIKKGDCFFNTGDILYMDHYGYFYFKDRTGDTFRWRGENVSTTEVESVISTLIGLKDAIVYGVSIPNVEGRAGMAAIADIEQKLDLKELVTVFKKNLPAYARPLFIRIMPEPPMTTTFKLKKKDLMEQGFNPSAFTDPVFFLDQKKEEYVRLTPELYEDVVHGRIRL